MDMEHAALVIMMGKRNNMSMCRGKIAEPPQPLVAL